MNSREISEYKTKIMLHLLSDKELVSLLDTQGQFEYPDEMIYQRIFPYGRIPDTELETKTYITVMVDVPSLPKKNDLVRDVTVMLRVLSHESLMQVPGENGTRIDLLSARVDALLNESYDFGIGPIALVYNKEFVLDNKHFYRELKFQTLSLNNRRYGA